MNRFIAPLIVITIGIIGFIVLYWYDNSFQPFIWDNKKQTASFNSFFFTFFHRAHCNICIDSSNTVFEGKLKNKDIKTLHLRKGRFLKKDVLGRKHYVESFKIIDNDFNEYEPEDIKDWRPCDYETWTRFLKIYTTY